MITRVSINELNSDQLDELQAAAQALNRVTAWIAGEPVTARTEFGDGYREALRDIADAIGRGHQEPADGPRSAQEPARAARDVRDAADTSSGRTEPRREAAA